MHLSPPAASRVLGAVALLAPVALVLAPPAAAATSIVVTSTGDAADARDADGVCAAPDGSCTLRAALQTAADTDGPATIGFALVGTGPFTLSPASRLPSLTNPAGTTIDGFTQPGAAPASDEHVDDARILVQLRGQTAKGFDGLTITSSGNTVRGLAVYDFAKAFSLAGPDADGNRIVGNHVCTDAAGTFRAPSVNTRGLGISLSKGAGANALGAPGPENRNTVSGCAHRGIVLSFAGSTGNRVQNNIIGLTPRGDAALPNRSHGVDVNYTSDNLVGGAGAQEGNVISGNLGTGVEISHGRGTHDNEVVGNLIGSDPTGTAVTDFSPNRQWGIRLEGPKDCSPCTDAAVAEGLPGSNRVVGNTVVGNGKGGLLLDKGQHEDVVRDNRIGVLPGGAPGGNRFFGIRLERGAYDNTIGPGNEIAFNPKGITLQARGYAPPGDAQPTPGNRITANLLHDNGGLGIDLAPFGRPNTGGVGDPLVNEGVQAPVVDVARPEVVAGRTCPGCTVEVFASDVQRAAYGEGARLLGTGAADADGRFRVEVTAVPDTFVTATATTTRGSTSEFGRDRRVRAS